MEQTTCCGLVTPLKNIPTINLASHSGHLRIFTTHGHNWPHTEPLRAGRHQNCTDPLIRQQDDLSTLPQCVAVSLQMYECLIQRGCLHQSYQFTRQCLPHAAFQNSPHCQQHDLVIAAWDTAGQAWRPWQFTTLSRWPIWSAQESH